MTARDLLRFQFGAADAIRAVAASRAALPTGVLLVLLTAVARSYDQTWIGENPFLWLLGPLLFSLVSGTWLFLVVYAGFVRANWAGEPERFNKQQSRANAVRLAQAGFAFPAVEADSSFHPPRPFPENQPDRAGRRPRAAPGAGNTAGEFRTFHRVLERHPPSPWKNAC